MRNTLIKSFASQTSCSKYTRQYQPRHPLAKQIIEQIDKLELRPQNIVKSMGYLPKHTIPACERLRHVLSNRYLGLDGSYIDGRFTAEEFLQEILLLVDIAYETVEDDISHLHYQLSNDLNTTSKKQSLVKTNFECS